MRKGLTHETFVHIPLGSEMRQIDPYYISNIFLIWIGIINLRWKLEAGDSF